MSSVVQTSITCLHKYHSISMIRNITHSMVFLYLTATVCPKSLKGLLWTNFLSILNAISPNTYLVLERVTIAKEYS